MAVKDEFDELYRREHTRHFTPARTALEVDALVTALSLEPSERILDLGCGWGRHLSDLKRRGFTNLVGVDVQGAFLEPVADVVLLEQDAAALEFDHEFDAVYCAFNALFSTPDAASQVFASVAGALKPGGRFLFDTTNRERLAEAESPARSWRGGGELAVVARGNPFRPAYRQTGDFSAAHFCRRPHPNANADALSLHGFGTQPASQRCRTLSDRYLWRLDTQPAHRAKLTFDVDNEKGSLT